jgi:hypothetical protein
MHHNEVQAMRRRLVVAPADAALAMLEEAVSDFFWVALFMANTLHTAAAKSNSCRRV